MKGFARTANRGKSRNIAKSFAILRENVGSQFRSLHYGIEARHVMGTAIIVAGLMGAAGIILAAAGAHAASRAGLDSAGYILLFHAAALLGAAARSCNMTSFGVPWAFWLLLPGPLARSCFPPMSRFAPLSGTAFSRWRLQPAESFSLPAG